MTNSVEMQHICPVISSGTLHYPSFKYQSLILDRQHIAILSNEANTNNELHEYIETT